MFTFDATNNLNVTLAASSGGVLQDNITQWGGTAVSPPPNGTGAPAVVAGGPASTNLITVTSGTPTQNILTGQNNYATLLLEVVANASVTGGTWVIEGSTDNANWQSMPGFSIRQGAYFGGTYGGYQNPININASSATIYNFSVIGLPYLRIRVVAAITGASASVTFSYGLISVDYAQPVTNPSIVLQSNAIPDVSTALGVVNTLTAAGSLACTQYVSPGTTTITNDPGSNSSAQALRTPAVFKTATATASGNTAVWTPTSGRKFRLMRFKVEMTGDATAAATGIITIGFQDNTTDLSLTHSILVGTTSATAPNVSGRNILESGWIDLGNGILSAVVNNVLNVNLSSALSTGTVRVIVCGTEE